MTENINSHIKGIADIHLAAVSVDCVIITYKKPYLYVLAIPCLFEEYKGLWSLIGELVYPDENLDEAAQRILMERTGLEGLYLDQVLTFGDPKRHHLARVVTVAYLALVNYNDYPHYDNDNSNARWIPIKSLNEMAFDHKHILEACIDRFKKQYFGEHIWRKLLPEKFTLTQVQELTEAIISKDLDKRNFRKKILNTGVLVDIKEQESDVMHRPAKLYKFDERAFRARNL